MKAWNVVADGEPRDVLELRESDVPTPADDQVLVRVRAAATNFPDVLLCRGQYQERFAHPYTPGIELCGEVVSVGRAVQGWAPGERVLGGAALPAGAFAELALMPAHDVFYAPESLDDAEAASLHVAYQTAWFALHHRARILAGETLLVHAAAGGVGSAAVQLGKAAGARVIAVVGGPSKVAVARGMGADVVVDRGIEDFVEVVKQVTDGRGADVVFDPVGGDSFVGSTRCINFEGRIVLIGFAGGDVPQVRANHVLIKNYSVLGLHWGVYRRRDPELVRACFAELVQLADAGSIKPLVSERLPLTELPSALDRLGAGNTVGRVVVLP
jgi:NADPH2:quinone reductase